MKKIETSRAKKKRAAMLALVRVLAKRPAAFERVVRRGFDHPNATADALEMDPDDELLVWIALVTALEDADQIAAIDHNEDAAELLANIDWRGARRVAKDRARWAWAKELELEEIAASQILPRVAGELAERGICLASLDVQDDAYYLLLLDRKRARDLVRFARAAGLGKYVEVIRGKRPKPKPKTPAYTRLEYKKGGSKKFWAARVLPRVLETTWGRIGTAGQRKRQSFSKDGASAAAAAKLIAAKLRKGYVRA